jgi:hypothetical protein
MPCSRAAVITFGRGEFAVAERGFEQVPDLRPHLRPGVADRLAEQPRGARVRAQHAQQHLHQCCLAGAVQADQRVDLAGDDGQVDTVDGLVRAEPQGQALRGDHRARGR